MDELEKAESQHLKTQLDTTMTLRELRDQLVNLKFTLEEKEIVLEQSKFEPPATIRQAEIELDKAQRTYSQTVENYDLKVRQSVADMREAEINLDKARRKVEELKKIISKFTIYAPQSGMVIYKKEWSGEKRKVGSSINPWDMTVATLPDLSSMTSKTFVNEVDISKVKEGQDVRIGVDAFPERSYTGVVTSVANVGEQLPNTDAKVFEVLVRIEQSDTILRPAMTTSNEIVTQTFEDVNYIPLEAVHANDSLSFVYLPSKSKQIVLLGAANENYVIVEKGLAKGDEVLLSVPEEPDSYKYTGKELIPLIEEQRAKEEAAKESASDEDNSWDTIKARRQKRS
jgi:multidrug efflux pump subunit AcrA (membrane-fusion protein)